MDFKLFLAGVMFLAYLFPAISPSRLWLIGISTAYILLGYLAVSTETWDSPGGAMAVLMLYFFMLPGAIAGISASALGMYLRTRGYSLKVSLIPVIAGYPVMLIAVLLIIYVAHYSRH